jgi:monoamine oxidase
LPVATEQAIDGLGMGALTKIGLRYRDRKRFGIPDGAYLSDLRGTRDLMNFDCFTLDRDLVIVTFGGDMARELIAGGEAAAVALARDRFAGLVGGEANRLFGGGKLYPWWGDPFALGCYSYAKPGHSNARENLAVPVAEKLFFAGEATGGGPDDEAAGGMTAGGAVLAGRAAAKAAARTGTRRLPWT